MFKLNPYLRFNDAKCREAMNFYKSILGGTLTVQTVGESPMAKEMPEDKQDLIMHAELASGGDFKLYGSDMMREGGR
jgi:PhnB protein